MSDSMNGTLTANNTIRGSLGGNNTIKGVLGDKTTMNGQMQTVYGKDGASAYEIAVKNGFEGTEQEWLDSLYLKATEALLGGLKPKMTTVTLLAEKWVGEASPYTQVISIEGITKNSKIDLNPSNEQLSIFHNKDIAFVVGNKNGVITVYCIGQKPANDYTMQATITEVVKDG